MQFSVKVMKSYDYSHFEFQLSDEVDTDGPDTTAAICDELGIAAQQACDRQIERYKLQKVHCSGCNPFTEYSAGRMFTAIEHTPEASRTPEMKAVLKAKADYLHWRNREFSYEEECEFNGPPDYSIVEQQLQGMYGDEMPF